MPIDRDNIASLLGFTRSDLDMLLTMFVQNATGSLEEMKSAIETKDMQSITDTAHAISGGAGNFQLKEIYDLAMTIELAAKKGENRDYHLLYQQLKTLIDSI